MKSRAQLEEIAKETVNLITNENLKTFVNDGKIVDFLSLKFADALEAVQREAEAQLALSKKREKILREGLEECFRQWDGLGPYKDDDFGHMHEAITKAKKSLEKADEVK